MLFSLRLEEPDMRRREGMGNSKHVKDYKAKGTKRTAVGWSRVSQKIVKRNQAG